MLQHDPAALPAAGGFRTRLRTLTACAPVLFLLVAAGCRQEPAQGADEPAADRPTARIEASIQDAPIGAAPASAEDRTASGEMVGNYIISLYSEEGFWVDIGREAEMTIPIRDASGARPFEVTADVPEGTYSRVRILLCHSSVDLEPGSRVGGKVLDSAANVHITETGDVIVEREVGPFQVGPDSPVRLDVDLNTPAWLTEDALASGEASIPTLEREVEVAVRNLEEG